MIKGFRCVGKNSVELDVLKEDMVYDDVGRICIFDSVEIALKRHLPNWSCSCMRIWSNEPSLDRPNLWVEEFANTLGCPHIIGIKLPGTIKLTFYKVDYD